MDKIYCGNGKEKVFDNGGSIVRIVVDMDVLQREFAAHGFTTEQGKKKITLNVGKRREADQYGNTHGVTVDTFKPTENSNTGGGGTFQSAPASTPPASKGFAAYKPAEPVIEPDKFEDDIPF